MCRGLSGYLLISARKNTMNTPSSPTSAIRVAVGSSNPCKIEAVRKAFEDVFGASGKRKIEIHITSFNVPSGVPDQPYGDAETREGAANRAKAAYDAACTSIDDVNMHPDFAVGLEGGLERQLHQYNHMTPEQLKDQNNSMSSKEELWCMAWVAILGSPSEVCVVAKAEDDNYCCSAKDEKRRALSWGYAKTGSFLLPTKLRNLILNNKMELGHADDLLFNRVNSKHGQGTVGRLTDGQIDRDEYYVHALKLALIPWIRPELYLDNCIVPDSTRANLKSN